MKTLFTHKLPQGKFTTFDSCPNQAICVKQTHSNIVLNFEGQNLLDQEADGIIMPLHSASTFWPTIKTADCLPICLLGKTQVAMLHAGWRGLAENILQQKDILKLDPFYAFIGPSIHSDSFEVTKEFYKHFPGSTNFKENDARITFDLQAEAADQLKSIFSNIKVEDSGKCTYKDDTFYSYRRDKSPLRNWNAFIYN